MTTKKKSSGAGATAAASTSSAAVKQAGVIISGSFTQDGKVGFVEDVPVQDDHARPRRFSDLSAEDIALMISDEENDGDDDSESGASPESAPSGDDLKENDDQQNQHSKWIWLHAAYHCLVTIVGTGILGFPYATAYLGFAGSAIFITVVTASAYYTAILLTNLQKPDQGTYSELANGCMGIEGWANYWVRPFQYLNFFPTVAVMILVGGQSMLTMDIMSNGVDINAGNDKIGGSLSERSWIAIMGAIVMLLSLLPDLHSIWQVSLFGSVSVVLITFYCIAGPSVAIAEDFTTPDYGRPAGQNRMEYTFSVMTSFGEILFGYGFHTVLPDIQASLHDSSSNDAHADTRKAVTASFSYSYFAYMVVALLGYAAFGSAVQSNVLMDITFALSFAAMYVVWAFVVVKTATEGTVYNQAAFTLLRDSLGTVDKEDHLDHHPTNWKLDVLLRFIWVAAATV